MIVLFQVYFFNKPLKKRNMVINEIKIIKKRIINIYKFNLEQYLKEVHNCKGFFKDQKVTFLLTTDVYSKNYSKGKTLLVMKVKIQQCCIRYTSTSRNLNSYETTNPTRRLLGILLRIALQLTSTASNVMRKGTICHIIQHPFYLKP